MITDDWFADTVEVKRYTIKSSSPFTKQYQTIIDSTIVDADSQNMDNYLFNTNFISFLKDYFMPFFLIWSGFVFRNLKSSDKNGRAITHITSGSIEKEFGTIKKANGHLGQYPADYAQTRVASTLTNCLISQSTILKKTHFILFYFQTNKIL
jgi:hypothetical protein